MKGLTNVAASVQETTRYHCRMSRQGVTRPTGTETGPPWAVVWYTGHHSLRGQHTYSVIQYL